MNVHLGSVFDEFVAALLKTGHYQTQSEVLREGLRLLKEREEVKQLRLTELRKEIAVGTGQADQGLFVDGPEALSKIRQRSMQRKRSKGWNPTFWRPARNQDINDIWEYIASDNIEAADRVLGALEKTILKLVKTQGISFKNIDKSIEICQKYTHKVPASLIHKISLYLR